VVARRPSAGPARDGLADGIEAVPLSGCSLDARVAPRRRPGARIGHHGAFRTPPARTAMLRALVEFFDRHVSPATPERDDDHAIRLATAALLVETVRIDAEIRETERAAALAAVRSKFGLPADEAERLIALADEEARLATDYFQFTSLINRRFTPEQKLKVIEAMWAVAWADAEISAHERHLMRRIVDLLHVPHADAVAAQARAREKAGGG
jgi:uncharacterized tellurite resistance protein B-like protein